MKITRDLARFCVQTSYASFPKEVVDRAKYVILDFIGVTARGSIVDLSRVMLDFVRDLGADPQGCVVIGTDIRAVPQYSALANGTSSHAIEVDDVNYGHGVSYDS